MPAMNSESPTSSSESPHPGAEVTAKTSPSGNAMRNSLVTFVVIVVDVLILLCAAASRVGRVDPQVARFEITASTILIPLLVLVFGIGWIVLTFRLATGRFVASDHAGSITTLALVPVAVLAANLAPLSLVLPLANDTGPVGLPLLAAPAGRYLPWLNVLLALEVALAVARILEFRPKLWWQVRMASRLFWAALLILIILGPNLLRGDALEWSTGLSSAQERIPQRWLIEAPRTIESWWPGIQVLLGVGLLVVFIRAARDLPMFLRSFRKG
jgi:hypothetical protein